MQKEDDDVGILNAILTNTAIKIFFGGLEPNDADLAARILFTGHIDLVEEKPFYRPVAIGQNKTSVANWSRADMTSESVMHATSRSHARGSGRGTFSGTSTSHGTASGAGESAGQVSTPPFQLFGPNAPNASIIPVPMSQSVGQSSSQNSSDQLSESSGETFSEFEMHGESETEAYGSSRGMARSEGESEVFVTRYQWLAAELYSLPEQLHRLTGELMNLPPREVFVKIRGGRPFRTRTADLAPAFRSAKFKREMLPLYRARAVSQSPYIKSCDAVDAELAARLAAPVPEASIVEHDFSAPEPNPIDDPVRYAERFAQRRRPGRRPQGELSAEHGRFRVVDGEKGDNSP